MKIYTRTGDSGETSLFGGGRVSKSSDRIESYGTVDELNSSIGLARAHGLSEESERICQHIQNNLFKLGADLATPAFSKAKVERIVPEDIRWMEQTIDELEETLPPLKFFILPGGSSGGATLHLSRTICRRAERIVIACREQENISQEVVIFLNRLSDLLFVLARYENHQAGIKESRWQAGLE